MGIMFFFITVPTGDLAEILLLALLLLLLSCRVRSCSRDTTGTGTSLFFLSFFSLLIFFLFFSSFLGDRLGSLLRFLGAIQRLRPQSRGFWLSFIGLFVTWLLGRQLGI